MNIWRQQFLPTWAFVNKEIKFVLQSVCGKFLQTLVPPGWFSFGQNSNTTGNFLQNKLNFSLPDRTILLVWIPNRARRETCEFINVTTRKFTILWGQKLDYLPNLTRLGTANIWFDFGQNWIFCDIELEFCDIPEYMSGKAAWRKEENRTSDLLTHRGKTNIMFEDVNSSLWCPKDKFDRKITRMHEREENKVNADFWLREQISTDVFCYPSDVSSLICQPPPHRCHTPWCQP